MRFLKIVIRDGRWYGNRVFGYNNLVVRTDFFLVCFCFNGSCIFILPFIMCKGVISAFFNTSVIVLLREILMGESGGVLCVVMSCGLLSVLIIVVVNLVPLCKVLHIAIFSKVLESFNSCLAKLVHCPW